MSKTFRELVEELKKRENIPSPDSPHISRPSKKHEDEVENDYLENEDDPMHGSVGGEPRAEGEKVFAKAHLYPVTNRTAKNDMPYPAKGSDDVVNARGTKQTKHSPNAPGESTPKQGSSKLPEISAFNGSRSLTRANSQETRGDANPVRTSPSAVKGIQESVTSQLNKIQKSGGTLRFQNGDEAFVSAQNAKKLVSTMTSLKADNAKKFQDTINSSPAGLMKMMKFVGGND